MKRVGNLYDKMITQENMDKVYAGVMKGKHRKNVPGSIAFMIRMNSEYYKAEAARLLYERSFKPSKPRESIRLDRGSKKLRKIQAPKLFPDQFIHWAIMIQLQPIFMKGMDDWCCASVKGRGTLYAKNFIESKLDNSIDDRRKIQVTKKYKYCLKMDIRKFFENIDTVILMVKLRKKIKDEEMLELCKKIIDSTNGPGLPLGYYTSQWFANFYLEEFDHYIREVLLPKYGFDVYVRYMDDMIILGSNKRKLYMLMQDIILYLKKNLKMELKNTSCVIDIAKRGIDFIGYKFYFGKTILRKRILHNTKSANKRLYKSKFTLKHLQSANAYHGWTMHSDTRQFEDKYLQGSRSLEADRLKIALNKSKQEYERSSTYEHLLVVESNIIKLRHESETKNDHVLIRYYPKDDSIKVVARTNFIIPKEESNKK